MRLPRLPVAFALVLAVALAAPAAQAADPRARFGTRSWRTTADDVVAASRLDLFAVAVPGAADKAAVVGLVEQLLVKIPGVDVGLADVWTLNAELTAIQLTAALQPGQAALFARALDNSVGGHLWPALGRGPKDQNGIPAGRAFSDDHLVIRSAPGQLDSVLAAVVGKVDGTQVVKSARIANTAILRVGAAFAFDAIAAANAIRTVAGVVAAEPDLQRELRPTAVSDDPLYTRQWHLSRANAVDEAGNAIPGTGQVHADDAWDTTRGDSDVVIAVFDSGTDWRHPDLIGNVRQDLQFDPADLDNDPSPECEGSQDGAGISTQCNALDANRPYRESHGTSVSGTIAAKGDNQLGVTGVCPECSLMPVRLLGEATNSSLGTAEVFAKGCDPGNDGTGAGAWAINNSWGPGFSLFFPLSSAERDAFDLCRDVGRGGKGTVILFATGNEQADVSSDAYAKHPYVIGVAASTNLDDWAYYSNYGAEVDVTAPSLGGAVRQDNFGIVCTDVRGDEGYSTAAENGGVGADYTANFSGTSAATPVASGVVGLMLSVNADLSAEQVRLVLTRSAEKIETGKVDWLNVIGQDLRPVFAYDDTEHSIAFGYGRVDAAAAVALALNVANLGSIGTRCDSNATCGAGNSCVDGVCLDACTEQSDCPKGSVCTDSLCELPNEKPGSFLSPCDDVACVECVNTFNSQFEQDRMCTIACDTDEDCEPSCADGECNPDRFDCRPATDDPAGLKVCAVGDPNAGGPADFGACFNFQLFTSIIVQTTQGRELCGDICFGDGPAACAYGFHCADNLECTCTRGASDNCREYTCFESPGNTAGPFGGIFPICVPNDGHGDECKLDDDCQAGDYCTANGVCHYDDRQGCDICQPCESSNDCAGRGVCVGRTQANPIGVCSTACDDGEKCPGDSVCRDVNIAIGGNPRPRVQQLCLDDAVEDTVDATVFDYCAGFTCTVPCRDDVACPDNGVCTDGVCGQPVAQGEGEGEGDGDLVLGGGGLRWGGGCSAVESGSALPLLALLGLLRRRRHS